MDSYRVRDPKMGKVTKGSNPFNLKIGINLSSKQPPFDEVLMQSKGNTERRKMGNEEH